VPQGTELDRWQDKALISLVGFRFVDTRVLGVPIPGHRSFEEVNLRFYVRRRGPDGDWRRAVVFIRELVPRRAIALVARLLYNEPYHALPMSHRLTLGAEGGTLQYGWRLGGEAFRLEATVAGHPAPLQRGTECEFITEHFWGYTRQRDGGTLEYRVEHPPWQTWVPTEAMFSGPSERLYGAGFGAILAGPPHSAYVALGSAIAVWPGVRLTFPT
jgi:uncharacterized protein YqjF (DUF2071 family)